MRTFVDFLEAGHYMLPIVPLALIVYFIILFLIIKVDDVTNSYNGILSKTIGTGASYVMLEADIITKLKTLRRLLVWLIVLCWVLLVYAIFHTFILQLLPQSTIAL